MEPMSVETMRRIARVGGFEWTDAELERVRPAVERALAGLEALERLPLADVESSVQYRVL
jgi:hypothetical protein